MLRIINMEEATATKGSFAIWDTLVEKFYKDDLEDQEWASFEDFKHGCSDVELVDRVRSLLPDNMEDLRNET